MLDEIVEYCHQKYQSRENVCTNCNNALCLNDTCEQCLKGIHFDPYCHRSYDCPNMCNYYVCQNIYRYATEMAWIWFDFITQNTGEGKPFQQLEICSIGCGPCSELVALEEYCSHNNLILPYSYVGFDIENTWNEIQGVVKNNSSHPNAISFEHTDVFDYYNTHNKPNVIVLNYVISSMVKNAPNSINAFVDHLCNLVFTLNPFALLINDINHYSTRSYFDRILLSIISQNNGISVHRFHFENTQKYYYPYGIQRKHSRLLINPNNQIQQFYSPNSECHSAQIMIIKK